MWKKKARPTTTTDVVNVVETASEPTLQEVASEAIAATETWPAKKVVTKKRSTRKTATKTITTKKK
jgi:hypothetical protein